MSTRRIDGRKNLQMRSIEITPGFLKFPAGSAVAEFGNTRVLCSASVLEEVPPWMRAEKKTGGWITGEYQMIPGSTSERNRRETTKIGGRTHEIQRLIGRCLRGAVNLEKLGARTIYIDCEVLDADGGTRCAGINGGMVALEMALAKLMKDGLLKENPLVSRIAAVSVGMLGGKILLDLCYEEDSKADVDMNVVMNDKMEFIEVQSTAEHCAFNEKNLRDMLSAAKKGIKEIFSKFMKTVSRL